MNLKKVNKKDLKEYENFFDKIRDYVQQYNAYGRKNGKSNTIDSFQHKFLFALLILIKEFEKAEGREIVNITGKRKSIRLISKGVSELL